MPRNKERVARQSKKKKIFKKVKGYRSSSKLYKTAVEASNRAEAESYKSRRMRKRDFRRLWITRINAAARFNGISYSRFIDGLKKSGVQINRKMLAEIAVNDSDSFAKLARVAKENIK